MNNSFFKYLIDVNGISCNFSPIILHTSFLSKDVMKRAKEAGATYIFEKGETPFVEYIKVIEKYN